MQANHDHGLIQQLIGDFAKGDRTFHTPDRLAFKLSEEKVQDAIAG
jgi:hypothetical protein